MKFLQSRIQQGGSILELAQGYGRNLFIFMKKYRNRKKSFWVKWPIFSFSGQALYIYMGPKLCKPLKTLYFEEKN
jgi:hypothetical protein